MHHGIDPSLPKSEAGHDTSAYKFHSYLKIFMLREGEGKSPRLLTKFSAAYKLFFLLKNFCLCVQILHLFKNVKGGGGQAPQPCCLQILWLLTNFHTVYRVRHGFTHSTFFFLLDYYDRSTKESIPEGPSLRERVLPFYHVDLRMK